MEEQTAIEKISLKPISKAQKMVIVEQVREAILSGNQDPLMAEVALKGLEEMIDETRKMIRFYVMQELDKYPEKTIVKYGAEITREDRRTFDYSACGDSAYDNLKEAADVAKSQMKDREKFLKAIPIEGVITTDGEIIRPPVYTTATVLKISIK